MNTLTFSDYGLLLFILVVVGNLLGLLFDDWLIRHHLLTITARVQAAPYLGIPILAWQALGVVGLFVHFYE